MNNRIYLVTPLRDEVDNIEPLFSSIAAQDVKIEKWVIVENGSTDGSVEKLNSIIAPPNVNNLTVLNIDTEDPEYALGWKYARIVNRGFQEITSSISLGSNDYIGILDADSFPDAGYYKLLVRSFNSYPNLGITSGHCYDIETGRRSRHNEKWVLGSCRLWRGACFNDSGYIIGPSADTLSVAKAEIAGWDVSVTPGATFKARTVGERINYSYYGKSAHYRGETTLYIFMRTINMFLRGNIIGSYKLLFGYVEAALSREPKINDEEIIGYYRSKLYRLFLSQARRYLPINNYRR